MQLSEGGARTSEAWIEPLAALEGRTSQVESTVAAVYEQRLASAAPEGLAVLAVGGFGRRELFPQSDVDLVLLTERRACTETQRSAIGNFLRALWDCGLRISQSVWTVADCSELHDQNIELSISLLDERFLAGDRGLHAKLGVALARFFHSQRQALARHLCRLARERHAKHGDSIYHLEPNLKEGPGGLRDYQLVMWLSRLHHAEADRLPRADPPPDLVPSRDFLFAARTFLHLRAGRDSNTLTFDLEDEIAEALGIGAAEWMRRYYAHAKEIRRAALREVEVVEEQASKLLLQFRDWRSRVSNAEFHVSRERVYIRAPHRIDHDPLLVLRLFQFAGRHGLRLAPETERRLAQLAAVITERLGRPEAPVWPDLREILAQPHAAVALRAMQETGVLSAIFPEWAPVECLVVRDFYHRYTVDEHTLRAIEALESLRDAAPPAQRPFAELLSEIDDSHLLKLALLFHDLGKAALSGRHVPESVRLARQAMERTGVPEEQRRIVGTLIERHLELSKVMTSRDLDDPATGRQLAETAGTLEILKKLTLLTYADISAVNPTAMTAWRREQLWRVYLVAYNELTHELISDRIAGTPPVGIPGVAEFVEGFPVRYLRTHSDTEIAAHFALSRQMTERGVGVDVQRGDGFYELSIVALDRPALLASIAGALAGFGMNILKAEGFANRQGVILDTLVFTDPHRTLELNPTETDRLRLTLERVVLGKLDVRELLRRRPVPAAPSKRAHIVPSVSFDPETSESATLIQVIAQDRPGLLYALASAISEAHDNIELVLIDTEAHKAIDVFYVTAGGKKLTDAQQEQVKEKLLAACGQ